MVLEILYEDDYIVVVNKPNDILMYPSYYARNITEPTLIEVLTAQLNAKYQPLHRLDRKTSGVVIFGKTSEVARTFQELFAANLVNKTYLAVVRGFCNDEGIIDTPVKNEDTGVYKEALTHYKTRQTFEWDQPVTPYPQSRYSLLELSPKTGRMHQLRKHLNKISHPIIGDHKYGDRNYNRLFTKEFGVDRLLLHAAKIEFQQPFTEEQVILEASLPSNWSKVFDLFGWEL